MKHLGDITQMSGYEIPPVDVITFGSPCQDLSIAGKRAGMAGERSGLFSEAVRIIREMRMATWGMYPKYAVWENVPGAYSSNKGEDFHAVIESLCQIIDPGVSVPRPKSKQRGGFCGPTPEQSWETVTHWLGAQWMPSIGEFPNVESVSRLSSILQANAPERYYLSQKACEGILRRASRRGKQLPETLKQALLEQIKAPPLSYTLKIRSGCEGGGKGALVQTEKSATLSTLQDQTLFVADALPFDTTQLTSPQNGSNPQWGDPCHPLAASAHTPAVVTELSRKVFCIAGNVIDRSDTAGANGTGVKEDVSYTLNTVDRPAVVYDARGNGDGKVVPTMTGDHNGHISDYSTVIVERVIKWIVRRLTPTECERLQGYPDNWTALGEWIDSKGKLHKDADSPRYKALGNSIALPQWYYVLGGISDRLTENATLGSLFDGIGGFPKVWADLHNGNKKLCVWASEIEEFPIAVTRKHFPEE